MTVNMSGGTARNAAEIAASEANLGVQLPDDYRAFVAQDDGARPDNNRYELNEANGFGVSAFIPLARIAEERRYIENLPAARFPVAWDESGNYVCLETGARGGVYFWDHEEPHREYRLTDNFGQFLENLQPASPEDVKLDPADVNSAWIDPDFLRQLREKE